MDNYNEQNISDEVSLQQNTQVTERQERAIRLTQQIITNGNIAADCMVQMGRDLKSVRDERLYTEMGFDSFEDYCEKQIGIGKRHGYNFIQVFERFGEERLVQLQGLGITKLLEIAKLDNEDMEELMQDNDVAQMSVRQIRGKVGEYEKRIEQLTLELEDERSKNSDIEKSVAEAADLEMQLEEIKRLLTEANSAKDNAEERYSKQKAALIEEHRKEKQILKSELAELKDLKEENDYLTEELIKLRKQKEPIVKTELSEEDMERLRDEIHNEERESYYAEHKIQEDRHKEELKAAKEQADNERITAINAVRKQEAEKYAAEIEKLKAENTILQSNAQPAPAASGGYKAQINFLLAEISRAFESALGIVDDIEDIEEQAKYRTALERALKKLEESV